MTVDPNCSFGLAAMNGLNLTGFPGSYGSASLALSLEIPADTPAGSYNFTISVIDQDAANAYYTYGQTIASASGTVVITGGQAIAVTANNQTMLLGGPQPALTYTTNPPLPAYDTLTGSLACSAGSAVGNYPITQGTLALTTTMDDTLSFHAGTMSVQYGFNGPLSPYDCNRGFKFSDHAPIIWQYTNAAGTPVPSAAANPSISVFYVTPFTGQEDPVDEDTGCDGLQYDPRSYTWQYNWDTSRFLRGSFMISIQSGQTGQVNAFPIQVK
jgi:hypothetical protein